MIPDPPTVVIRRPPPRPGPPYHVIVKPAGAQCNLDCAYCFYLHKEDLLAQPKAPRMSDAVLEAHVRQYIQSQTGPQVVFTWQGGEPTLMGLDFFRRAVELQTRYRRPGQAVENDLQTNGILLDDAWCAFLKENRFLVGLSIDGPRDLHDRHRRAKGGQPTFDRVMAAVERLRRWEVPFNALCVVNRDNAKAPLEVYRFLRDEVRARVIQFIPCVEPEDFERAGPGGADRRVTDWSVEAEDWGEFLRQVWDEWFERDYGEIFVDEFENMASMLLGLGAQKCVSAKSCGRGLAIEHDGALFSCDHFVYPEHRLGSILETSEGALANSAAQRAFGAYKHESLPAYCRACPYLELCWGECPKNRFVTTPDGEPGLNYLCSGLKMFYGHVLARKDAFLERLG